MLSPEKRFAAAVRQAREARGWSQEALARELASIGLAVGGQSGVARIERADRPTRLNEVVQIAQLLGLDLSEVCAIQASDERVVGLLVDIRGLLTELVIPVRDDTAEATNV